MLEQLGPEIWTAEGPQVVAFVGFHYPTRMVVIRLPDSGLMIWSPIALSGRLRAAVDAVGPVRHILAPNSLHHLFLAEWKTAYPDARLHAAPGLRSKRRDIDFDADLGPTPDAAWSGTVDQVVMGGNLITSEVVFFHRPSRTAVFADLLQQLAPGWFSGWRAVVARLDHMVGPHPSVPRKFRLAFTDRNAARAAVRQVLDWPVERVVMAHGPLVEHDGLTCLRRAFAWLRP